jgi:hypothetical protein
MRIRVNPLAAPPSESRLLGGELLPLRAATPRYPVTVYGCVNESELDELVLTSISLALCVPQRTGDYR